MQTVYSSPSSSPAVAIKKSRFSRYPIELILPMVVLSLVVLGWYVGLRSKTALENAVTKAYQETQLEIVRAVSRSTLIYVQEQLERGVDIRTTEQNLLKLFVEPVRLLENGDAWIYAPDHVVFDLSSDFPEQYRGKSMAEIFALQVEHGASHYEEMTREVSNAREGTGWYVWLPEKGREIAAWTVVRFGAHTWTIGMSTPLREILAAAGADRQGYFILMLMTIGSIIGLAVTLLATWSLLFRQKLDHQLRSSHDELRHLVSDLQGEVERRKRTEERLLEANARLNGLIEAIPEAIVFKGVDGRNLVVNRAYERLVGRSKDFLLESVDVQLSGESLDMTWREGDEQVLRDGKCYHQERSRSLPDGDPRVYEIYKAPILDANERVIGLVGVTRDITDRKEAEKERERLTEQLMQAQKMEAIGALAGGVAHDLNNILAGIVSYPELILMKLKPDDPLKQAVLTIQKSGERAAGIVQDLLTLSRRGMVATRVLNLNQVVLDYVQSPAYERLRLDRPEIRTEINLEKQLLNMVGSPIHLSKMVMNLVINAFEAIEKDGCVLVSTENCYVESRLKGSTTSDVVEGEYVKLSVSDTGKGIPPQDLQRVFEPFYTKKVLGQSGTGLGLSVVWGVVQDHHGFINIHAREGGGTTFDLYFPLTREAILSTPHEPTLDAYRGHGERILVVDDMEMQRDIARDMLTLLGYDVSVVESGEMAVEYLTNHRADLIVLDMILGAGMDGLETYRRILEIHPAQKAIITSGYSESERVREAQRLGAGGYLKKPYIMAEIGKAVKAQLCKTGDVQ